MMFMVGQIFMCIEFSTHEYLLPHTAQLATQYLINEYCDLNLISKGAFRCDKRQEVDQGQGMSATKATQFSTLDFFSVIMADLVGM